MIQGLSYLFFGQFCGIRTSKDNLIIEAQTLAEENLSLKQLLP